MDINLDSVIKLLVVVLGGGGGGAWLMHFFASGEVRVADRRRERDSLESQLAQTRRELKMEYEVRNAAVFRLHYLSLAWDGHRDEILLLAETLEKAEPVAAYEIRKLKNFPTAQELLDGLPLPEVPS